MLNILKLQEKRADMRFGLLTRCVVALAFASGVVFSAIGCSREKKVKSAGAGFAASVTRGAIEKKLRSVSLITTEGGSQIFAESSGVVSVVHVKKGDTVKAGDPLVTVRDIEVKEMVREAELAKTVAACELAAAQEKGALQPELKKYSSLVEIADIKLTKMRRKLESLTVRSPISGKVVAVQARVGDFISARSEYSTGSGIAEVVSANEYRARITVTERDVPFLNVGQTAKVSFDAIPGLVINGRIREIESASTSSGVPQFPVIISFSSISADIKIGMTAAVELILAQSDSAMLVPINAVRVADGKAFVRLLADDGTEERRLVELGIDDGAMVEVRRGLLGNEHIIP